jgi:hypothetical protein
MLVFLKKLIGQIRALTEEGYTEANWFEFKVLYPKSDIIPHDTEIGGNLDNYKQLSKGTPNPESTERALVNWCKKLDFDITQVLVQEEPVHPNYA